MAPCHATRPALPKAQVVALWPYVGTRPTALGRIFLVANDTCMAVVLSVNLSDSVAWDLKTRSERRGISVSELVGASVATELWREQVIREGGRVLVEDASGEVHVVTFL